MVSSRPFTIPYSQLLHLSELELDRGGAAEDRHRDLHPRPPLVHFLDHAIERGERAVRHPHLLAHLERHRRHPLLTTSLPVRPRARPVRVRRRWRLRLCAATAARPRPGLGDLTVLVGRLNPDPDVPPRTTPTASAVRCLPASGARCARLPRPRSASACCRRRGSR